MSEQICILVLGMDPLASATARLLFLAGHAVAIYGRGAPKVLRRRMSFADAWSKGEATLDGVLARRARSDIEFVIGLRHKSFIPILTPPFAGATERWSWDGIVDGRDKSERAADPFRADARVRLGVGAGFNAGVDCDLAIATEGPDPGAVIRKGATPEKTLSPGDRGLEERIVSPVAGVFVTDREIGERTKEGGVLGYVEGRMVREAILAPFAGLILGLLPSGAAVAANDAVAELSLRLAAPFSGVSGAAQELARAVHFALEMELNGWEPAVLPGFA
jgi:xanthine dehydrogenase accessory factor